VTERIGFEPKGDGEFEDQWVIGSSAATGTQTVTLHGRAGSGSGLSASYFDGIALSSPAVAERIEPTIDFKWTDATPPAPGINAANFSARWTGQVEAAYSETYTFQATSDDGIRLWVNGAPLVNDWTDHMKTVDMGTIGLVAGQRYDLVLEYYNDGASGTARLQWASPSTPLEIVPSIFLFPSGKGGSTSP
jgi:hypothetical protein